MAVTQHWVGAMGSKNILAINNNPEANMVTKPGWAVIADLRQVIPAITEEVRASGGGSPLAQLDLACAS